MTGASEIVGILLAGGQSRRIGGGDKCLREVGGKTLLARVAGCLGPQVGTLVLNANGDSSRFAEYDLPVIPDVIEGFAGPLAGVLTGMEWCREERPGARWVVTVPTDTPFLPRDLVTRFLEAIGSSGAQMACASSSGRCHPVIGLWPIDLAGDLRHAMTGEGIRKIDLWTARYRLACPEWPMGRIDPFFNVNRERELAQAEEFLRSSM